MSEQIEIACASCSGNFSLSPAELEKRERHSGAPVRFCSLKCVGAWKRGLAASKNAAITSKVCSTCEQDLSIDMFSMKRSSVGSRQNSCKACSAEHAKSLRAANPEAARASLRASREKHRDRRISEQRLRLELNRDAINESRRIRRAKNPSRSNEQNRLWRQNNPEKIKALDLAKHAARKSRVAGWDAEFTEFVATEAVGLKSLREKVTGIRWHVDHQIPLQGKLVCGLHVWNNLSVVPAAFNLAKGNKVGRHWLERSWL